MSKLIWLTLLIPLTTYVSVANALTVTFANNTAASAHIDYMSKGFSPVKKTIPYHSKIKFTDGADEYQANFQVAQYGVANLPYLKQQLPYCYVSFNQAKSGKGWSWKLAKNGSHPIYQGCKVTGNGDNFVITLSWPQSKVDFASGSNHGNNVTDNTLKAISDFFTDNNNQNTFLLPNVLNLTKTALATQKAAVIKAYESGGMNAAASVGWEFQYAYDATRFPLWSGAYILAPKGNAALKTKLKTKLLGFTQFIKTHLQPNPSNSGDGVLPANGFWAQQIKDTKSGIDIKPGELIKKDYTIAPALEGPAAVAAKAVGDMNLYNQLTKSLSLYDLSKHTPASVPNNGNFVMTSSPYFNGTLDLISEALLAGHGTLNLTDNGASGYGSYQDFMRNYKIWIEIDNGFLAPFTVTNQQGKKQAALRVVFSAYQAPSSEGGNVGKSPTVSEGMGYGLIIAYAANDQTTFNKLLRFALFTARTEGCAGMNKNQTACTIKSNYLMPWMVDEAGKPFRYTIGGGYLTNGSATDADIQIAWAVALASERVTEGTWKNTLFNGESYKDLAKKMRNEIAIFDISDSMSYMGKPLGQLYIPGSQWGSHGETVLYPGYFTPAAFETLGKL